MKKMPDKVWVPMGRHIQFSFSQVPLPGEPRLIVTGPAWVEKHGGDFLVRKGEPPSTGQGNEGWLS